MEFPTRFCDTVDGFLKVYNSDLQFLGTLSSDNSYPGYASGFLEGLEYDELGGRVCTDLVEYNATEWIPASRTENGCLIKAYGELVYIPLQYNEELISLTDTYMVIQSYDGEDDYENYLIDRRTGERIAKAVWNEDYSLYFTLGKNYCMIQEQYQDGSGTVKILDKQNQISYTSDNVECNTWKNGYVLLRRGIYQGIADIEGNWVIRTTAGWGE